MSKKPPLSVIQYDSQSSYCPHLSLWDSHLWICSIMAGISSLPQMLQDACFGGSGGGEGSGIWVASYPGSWWAEKEREPSIHCLRMRLISQKSADNALSVRALLECGPWETFAWRWALSHTSTPHLSLLFYSSYSLQIEGVSWWKCSCVYCFVLPVERKFTWRPPFMLS